MQLYKRVELKEGEPVLFLGVHAVRWQSEWGSPAVGFLEADANDDLDEVIRLLLAHLDKYGRIVIDPTFGEEAEQARWLVTNLRGVLDASEPVKSKRDVPDADDFREAFVSLEAQQ